ncbi:MAG: hypothetical protein K2L34_01275, partial [Muribaculaceae bacterium]|nr:hypothetical protein [Muribaculaceae bacterium]
TNEGNGNKTVTFNLTNLKSNTAYVARGYLIMNEGGEKQYGPTSTPFTTAQQNPEPKNTPTPGT